MPHPLFKKPAKVLRIFETEFIGNLTDRFTGVEHLFLGYINKFVLDVFLRGIAGFLFHQITKIVGG